MAQSVDVGYGRDAGAAGALGAVDDRDVAAGAAQVVGGDEAIDSGTDDDYAVGHWGTSCEFMSCEFYPLPCRNTRIKY